MKDLQYKLKSLILSRIQDKEQLVDSHNINGMMADIKETKMAIENDLDDLR